MNNYDAKASIAAEKRILKKILKAYILAVLVGYAIVLIFSYMKITQSNDYIIILYCLFWFPLFMSAVYLLRSIYLVFRRRWLALKFCMAIMFICLIIGAGACYSNILYVGMLDGMNGVYR